MKDEAWSKMWIVGLYFVGLQFSRDNIFYAYLFLAPYNFQIIYVENIQSLGEKSVDIQFPEVAVKPTKSTFWFQYSTIYVDNGRPVCVTIECNFL